MAATLKDIANAVEVSATTVSKVLGGKEIRISEAKRQEILKEARRLKYVPTIAGVNLRKGRTDMPAVGFAGAAAEDGKRVPDDYSVVGMDDIMATQQNTPKITTVSQDVKKIADHAVKQFFPT